MSATIYHGTPLTPDAALIQLAGRAFCVSFFRPDNAARCEEISPAIMYDNGAFSAHTKGAATDWPAFYAWLEERLYEPGRWAVIPDVIDAGTQLQDALLNEWPHGRRGAPVWHMDEPVDRLLRLCSAWPRVCIGSTAEYWQVGGPLWRARMDEVAQAIGNCWPVLHMLRGVEVAADYPFPQRRQHLAGAEPSPLPIAAIRRDARRVARADRVCGQA